MFVVLEGIDGAGHTTQANLLKKFLEKNNIKYDFFKTPNKKHPIGKAYYDYLNKKYEANTETIFLLCSSDVMLNKERIVKARQKEGFILGERYITSTLAYQAANGFDFDKAIEIIRLVGFPKTDIIIYLDISVDEAIKRKKMNGKLDRHEENKLFLEKVKQFYEKQIEMNFLGKWIIVDAEKEIQEVNNEIIKIIKNNLKTK